MQALGYLFFAAPFVIAMLFALLLVVGVVYSTRSPWVVMGLLAMAMVADAAAFRPVGIKLGLMVYPGDAFAGITAIALAARVLFMDKFRLVPTTWWVFGAAQFILFAWGLAAHGTGAGVDFRPHFSAWVGAAYLATFAQDDAFIRKLFVLVQVIAWGVMAVAVYRWVYSAIDPMFARDLARLITTGVEFRVIWVAPTFMISVALLTAVFYATSDDSAGHWLLALVFAAFVLVLQHRTVWATTLAGGGVLALLLTRAKTGMGLKLAAAGMGVLVLVAVLASGASGVSSSIQAQAERAVGTGGTFYGGRVMGWIPLIQEWAGSGSPVTYLLGKPFGSGYERYTSDFAQQAVTYQPHNYYVQLLYRGGLIGLVAFVMTLWKAAKALRAQLDGHKPYAPLLAGLLAALVFYYIPYGVSYDHAIFLGLMLGVISRANALQSTPVGPVAGGKVRTA